MENALKIYKQAMLAKRKVEEELEEAIEVAKKARAEVYKLCDHDFDCVRLYDYKSYTLSLIHI